MIGKYFSVPEEKIKAAIENYAPSNSRSQLIQRGSNTFILDDYNANPASMKAAIDNFAKLSATKKILMLGGMMESSSSRAPQSWQEISWPTSMPEFRGLCAPQSGHSNLVGSIANHL